MNRHLWFAGLLIAVFFSACSATSASNPAGSTPEPSRADPVPGTITGSPTRSSLSVTASTPAPDSSPSLGLTAAPTRVPDCPAPDGYTWSYAYLPNSASILEITPSGDGNFILLGLVDGYPGTWLAKIDPDGNLLWQNIYGNSLGSLHRAENGNLVLGFSMSSLELNPDGSIIKGAAVPGYHPNADGSATVVMDGQVLRYIDPGAPLWQIKIKDLQAMGSTTSDGGAIFAYAGTYLDYSVYWVPKFTDIKVIKINEDGYVFQKTFGRLIGDEYLYSLHPTGDGGALLAGWHSYEELGSDYDIWLMKVNATGGMSWQTTLQLAPDFENLEGLFILNNGYAALIMDNTKEELSLVRIRSNGSLAWQKIISSARGPVTIRALADTADGGLLLSGETSELNSVAWLARLDANGNLVWEKTLGTYGIASAPDSGIQAILPLENNEFLVAGYSDLVGEAPAALSSAWIARLQDSGQKIGLLSLSPGRFAYFSSLGSRPNTLPDEVLTLADISIEEFTAASLETNLQPVPACLQADAQIPTPAALPSLTPSTTPTPSVTPPPALTRTLYLANPPMQGADVLKVQERLLALGYIEVGKPDGFFGQMTDAAVRRFQVSNALAVDGILGPKTWEILFSSMAK